MLDLMGRSDIPEEVRIQLSGIAAHVQSLAAAPLGRQDAFEQMVELNPYAMAILDADGFWVRGNRAFAQVFGSLPPPEYNLFQDPIAQRSGLLEQFERLKDGEVIQVEEVWYDVQEFMPERPSHRVCLRFVLFPLMDSEGKLQHVVGMYENITRRKEAEEKLIRSERLAAVGTLAAGVAHEFNNVNTRVVGFAELLQRDAELSEAHQKILARVIRAARRSSDITRDMLTFAGQRRTPRAADDLDDIAAEAVELISREFHINGVELVQRLGPVPPAMIRRSDMVQLVLNLLLNARQAVRGCPAPRVELETGAEEGWAVLVVRDNGRGIEAEHLGQIFSPFFSTKGEYAAAGSEMAEEAGTGLGLAVCLAIARAHGGDLSVRSQPGAGATFSLRIPLQEGGGEAAVPAPEPGPERLDGVRVAVVDDDADIRFLLEESLRDEGCEVRSSDDGHQVMAWVAAGEVDMVVADVIMPKMTGKDLFDALRALDPARRPACLFVSGLPDHLRSQELSSVGRVGVLPKPFTQAELAAALRRLLARA